MDRQPDCAVDVSPHGQRGQGDIPDPDPYLPGHGDLAYEVESYQIELDYCAPSNRLDARAEIVAVANQAMTLIRLDLQGLDVKWCASTAADRPGTRCVPGS